MASLVGYTEEPLRRFNPSGHFRGLVGEDLGAMLDEHGVRAGVS